VNLDLGDDGCGDGSDDRGDCGDGRDIVRDYDSRSMPLNADKSGRQVLKKHVAFFY
jgi:hypothetical protein